AVDALCCRRNLEAYSRRELFPAEKFRGDPEILDPCVRARAEERHVDLRPLDVLDGLEIRRIRRARDLRPHAVHVEGKRLDERRIVISATCFQSPTCLDVARLP